MRFPIVTAFAVLLTACSGPIVSERFSLDDARASYHGTAHGLYCLPKEYFRLTVVDEGDDGLGIGVVSVTAPDFGEVYRLGLDESWLSDDKITVAYAKTPQSTGADAAAAPSCLLSMISSVVTDQTPDIARTLTKTVLRGLTGKADAMSATTTGASDADKPLVRFATVFELQPDDTKLGETETKINTALIDAGLSKLQIKLHSRGPKHNGKSTLAGVGQNDPRWGVFGRLAQPYVISVFGESVQNKIDRLIVEEVVYAHNGVQPFFVAIDRGAFVKRATTIDFSQGYPVAINTTKDSELNAFMQIPLDIVSAIVSAPLDALEADKTLAENRAALIDAQKELIVKQREAFGKDEKKAAEDTGDKK
jgi:hypothetical protein